MDIRKLFKKALGDYRGNKEGAFNHGLKRLSTGILVLLIVLAILGTFGLIRPAQFFQATLYSGILFFVDYAMASEFATGLRFLAPELFGFLSFSTLISAITAFGAVSIAWRWERTQ